MQLRFSKFEGLGNDFLVVEREHAPHIDAPLTSGLAAGLAARLCDRHFGVGGDGVLLTGIHEGVPFMKVINADGSVPEMCGNGLRCVALYLVQRGLVKEQAFTIATDAGPHHVQVTRGAGREGQVQVAMRPPSLEAGEVLRDERGPYVNQPFEIDDHVLRMTAVSMGNPHAVTFDEVGEHMQKLGPRVERDPRFRAGVNVGFARMQSPTSMELTVWERGVGFTLACGTGACAAAVAAVETGRADRERALTVHLPGGPLTILVGARGSALSMTGPARHVFDGELTLEAP